MRLREDSLVTVFFVKSDRFTHPAPAAGIEADFRRACGTFMELHGRTVLNSSLYRVKVDTLRAPPFNLHSPLANLSQSFVCDTIH